MGTILSPPAKEHNFHPNTLEATPTTSQVDASLPPSPKEPGVQLAKASPLREHMAIQLSPSGQVFKSFARKRVKKLVL